MQKCWCAVPCNKKHTGKAVFRKSWHWWFKWNIKGCTGFAYSDKDAIAPIKVIKEYNKELNKINKSLKLKGCIFEGEIIGSDRIESLTNLPSRDELLSKFVAMLQSPLSNFANTLKVPGQNLIFMLVALKQKKTN